MNDSNHENGAPGFAGHQTMATWVQIGSGVVSHWASRHPPKSAPWEKMVNLVKVEMKIRFLG